ncbi:MAG: NUDIX domain-containing protein, partial [Actinomycetota bacterium]
SAEDAVRREVREEAGIEITEPRWFGSQSWPFPHSLMLGFTAEWAAGDIRLDPAELESLGWYTRDDLPVLPPPASIARRLIDAWLGARCGSTASPRASGGGRGRRRATAPRGTPSTTRRPTGSS